MANSWQQPVAGEPSCGTLHPHFKELVTNGTPAAGYYNVDVSAEVPVGTKAILLEVNHASAAAGRYISVLTNSTPTPTSAFLYVIIAVANQQASGSGIAFLTANRTFTYRASNTTLGLYIRMHGYFI
ncbi:MAG: hypothetical protein WC455_13540 [Dehalococcoidia bacterium]|jgi:hypothetical protein